jgi:hypothetical protein
MTNKWKLSTESDGNYSARLELSYEPKPNRRPGPIEHTMLRTEFDPVTNTITIYQNNEKLISVRRPPIKSVPAHNYEPGKFGTCAICGYLRGDIPHGDGAEPL